MKVTATIVFVYGLLVLIGGIIGYKTAGSPMSLIAGILSGLPLIGAGIAVAKGNLTGLYVALAMTFALDGFFTYRFAKTLSFMPAGLMSLLSLLVLIITALKIRKIARTG